MQQSRSVYGWYCTVWHGFTIKFYYQVKQRADEVKKSLDILILLNEGTEIHDMLGGSYDFKQFKGRMDVLMAALMGHSFGGGTTVKALSEDTRFKWVTNELQVLY